ncbi:lanosterol 14-alpha demethylase-like [Asterias rubens]|uniref:lanosterol 14-alpha demethylase-like n=1 Tax=Asterias rubens TaxID=7604 RepID=UPI00145544FE|nr:lanosterol 14-alpha demethylase-like [Asterias rubens]
MASGGAGSSLIEGAIGRWQDTSTMTMLLLTSTFILVLGAVFRKIIGGGEKSDVSLPPRIPSSIPFLGKAIEFQENPIDFLEKAYKKYGSVFSFTMVGQTFTYLIGPVSSAVLFNSKNDQLNAEEVYGRLTTPVFGKGVAYDVPNAKFLEQKKILKIGLNVAQFRKHIGLVQEEALDYLKRWKNNSGQENLFVAMSELIISTASRCLHGKEIRSKLDERVAQLYMDLDGGFNHLAWLFPSWIPFPSFRKRDKAHLEVKKIFYKAIQERRDSEDPDDDMLQTLLTTTYKNGTLLTDDEVAGMCIGLLLAGQHTSSTTSSWLGFYLAKNKDIQDRCYREQLEVCRDDIDDPLTYDQVKEMSLLDRCLKETLRLRPPIMTMMRMAKVPVTVQGYTIPPGHQVCVSPTVNQRIEDQWMPEPMTFNPDRFIDESASNSDKFSYVPFGAGRHRCIGENFAYVQIKTIMSVLIRKYELSLVDDYFPSINYKTMIHTPFKPIIAYKLRK